VTGFANRGSALEDLVVRANEFYRSKKLAVIHKVPTAWLPLRGSDGRIVSAKVEKKASVDFLGHVATLKGSLPVAFDAKEVTKGNRWPLSRLELHQYEYLRDCAETGAFSFVLIAFWELQRFFVLPFAEIGKMGSKSVIAGSSALIEVFFLNYLDFLLGKEIKNAVEDTRIGGSSRGSAGGWPRRSEGRIDFYGDIGSGVAPPGH
jgi:recombination protein U